MISPAQTAPATSPPMWAPTLIPGTPKLKARLRRIRIPTEEASASTPRPRAITKVAARIPKTAPEAPIESESGVAISAPSEPAKSETK